MAAPVPATYEEVVELLGELDPLAIARIVATGASVDEVDEAVRASEDELGFGDEPHPPSSPRVAEVRAVLDELAAEDADRADEEQGRS